MKYYFKTWLFTILVAPLVVTVILMIRISVRLVDILPVIPIWFFAVFFGAAFSLPSLFIFKLLCNDLENSEMNGWKKKAIVGSVGVLLVWLTFYVINRTISTKVDSDDLVWPEVYSVCLIVGSFICDINIKQEERM